MAYLKNESLKRAGASSCRICLIADEKAGEIRSNSAHETQQRFMPADNKSEADSNLRITLAKTVTTWALVAILAIAGLIIVVAGINAIRSPSEKTGEFFDIAKYVLGVLL